MTTERDLRVILVVATAVALATSVPYTYALALMYSGGPFGSMQTSRMVLDLSSLVRAGAELVAMLTVAIGLHRALAWPRLIPQRAQPGFLLAVVGSVLWLVPYALIRNLSLDPGSWVPYVLASAVGSVGLPLFLLGIGMMVLWTPPMEPMPAGIAPMV